MLLNRDQEVRILETEGEWQRDSSGNQLIGGELLVRNSWMGRSGRYLQEKCLSAGFNSYHIRKK